MTKRQRDFMGKLIRRLVDHQLWHTRVFFHGSDHGRVCHLKCTLFLYLFRSEKRLHSPCALGVRVCVCVAVAAAAIFAFACQRLLAFSHITIYSSERKELFIVRYFLSCLILFQQVYRRIYVYPRLGRFSHLTNIKWNLTNRYNFR